MCIRIKYNKRFIYYIVSLLFHDFLKMLCNYLGQYPLNGILQVATIGFKLFEPVKI